MVENEDRTPGVTQAWSRIRTVDTVVECYVKNGSAGTCVHRKFSRPFKSKGTPISMDGSACASGNSADKERTQLCCASKFMAIR